jgi:hypothetical protein
VPLLLAGLASLAPSILSAAPREVVLLVDAAGTAPATLELRRHVVERLAAALPRGRDWHVVQAPRPEEELRLQLTKLLADARARSERFEEQRALEALARAERVFRASFGVVLDVEPLVQVLLARTRLHADLGQSDEAEATLARVAAIDPRRELDPGRFAPALVRSFAELRAKQRSSPLSITTTPPGATIWVDGRPAGRGPMVLQLPMGEHFVAVGPIGETTGCPVRVGEEQALSLDARQTEARWRAMAQRAGATWIIVVQLAREATGTRVRARALPTRAGGLPRVLTSAIVDERRLGGAADALALRLAAQLAPAPVAPPPPPPKRVKLLRAWWFWTAVIVVVAGVATAAVVATRDRDPRVQLVLTR